eukprot:gene7033-7777_t
MSYSLILRAFIFQNCLYLVDYLDGVKSSTWSRLNQIAHTFLVLIREPVLNIDALGTWSEAMTLSLILVLLSSATFWFIYYQHCTAACRTSPSHRAGQGDNCLAPIIIDAQKAKTPTNGKATVEEANHRIHTLLDQLNLFNTAILNDVGLLRQLRDLHAIDRIPNINAMLKYKPRNMNETTCPVVMIAASENSKDVLKILLLHPHLDVNLSETNYRCTAIMWASYNGFPEIVAMLLAVPKIEVNYRTTPNGWTALMGACLNGHTKVVQLLLKYPGIDVNIMDDDDYTGLIWACSYGHLEIVRMLLKMSNIDVNRRSKLGQTAYKIAKIRGYVKVMEALQESGKCKDCSNGDDRS